MADIMDSTEEEYEPSGLEYARANGLSRNHITEPLPSFDTKFFIDRTDFDFLDDRLLQQFQLYFPIKPDRLLLSRESAELVSRTTKYEPVESFDDPFVLRSRRDLSWKTLVELPLLRSVNEVDRRNFARRDAFEINLKDIKFPLEIMEGEDSLDLDPKLFTHGAKLIKELKKEKLAVSREAIVLLSSGLRDDWTPEDEKKLWESSYKYNKSSLEPVTPPLSPLPKAYVPYEPLPSDAAFDLPVLSDPISLTNDDLIKLENQIMGQDAPTPIRKAQAMAVNSSDTHCGDLQLEELYSPLASMKNSPVKPERIKVEHMKVEETLTPPNPTSLAKTVHFNDLVETMNLKASTSPLSDSLDTNDFKELFGDAAEQALRRSEQEMLINADTTARVDVPLMDFSAPGPPWATFRQHTEPEKLLAMQRAIISENITANMRAVWRVQKQASLKWNPFPHDLAKVAVEEDFPYSEETWKEYVTDPKDDQLLDRASLTWKPPGLRILCEDEEDDDDEVEFGKFHKAKPTKDMAFLVRKRKVQLDERRAEPKCSSEKLFDPNAIFPINQPPATKVPRLETLSVAVNPLSQLRDKDEIGGILGGNFSTGAALDNFLKMRGAKKLKLTDSSYFTNNSMNPADIPATTSFSSQQAMQVPFRKSPVATIPLPAPTPVILSTAAKVVISTDLLRNRALVKLIERESPGIILVERDFTAHNSTIWIPNSVTRSPIASSLASEADIIISATAGIILTSLQKIKQKPLPGQKTKAAIRERIEKVCVRYEKLIVLVSEGSTTEITQGMDANDCEALGEFIGFASGLDCTVIVQIIGGSQETLAKWIASTIAHNHTPCDLLDDETHWEVFLRRAGMNAFAAQTVISALKAPEGVDPLSPSKAGLFGLTALVEMGREMRIARFGQVCGVRVMERVCAALDGVWK